MNSILDKLKKSLKKTSDNLTNSLKNIFFIFTKIDDEFFDKLEETLILNDVSVSTANEIKNELKSKVKLDKLESQEEIINMLKKIIENILIESNEQSSSCLDKNPVLILAVGVNGSGKTTTLGKMAFNMAKSGKKVLLAAADTFRAAAAEQLKIWSVRAGCDIVSKPEGSDPGSVVFEAIDKLKLDNFDVILCDTAGRLHNKSDLMAELSKIERIIEKKLPNQNKEFFLVLDATVGQNMVSQVQEFLKILKITGITITKLDGTARGGAIITVRNKFKIPLRYIGIGEFPEDLKEFNAKDFVEALFSGI
ncbi:MAG: signal recognition particle-docking protein FtsY [Oscillospiraceae bacterium]|nr:signal recognition particle-docking protein FtsY [Oscillospiraceae bacterium]